MTDNSGLWEKLEVASSRNKVNIDNQHIFMKITEGFPIIIYGATGSGIMFYNQIIYSGEKNPVMCFVDDNATKEKRNNCPKEILSLSEAIALYGTDVTYVIAANAYHLIASKLISYNVNEKNIKHFREPLTNTTTIKELTHYKNEILEAYSTLYDEVSKSVFENVLIARLTGHVHLLDKTYDSIQYFNNIALGSNETYIDAGAYNGDTIEKFVNAVSGKYNMIVAFEINDKNFPDIKKRVKDMRNVYLYNKGLFGKNTILHYDENGGSDAALCNTGGGEIEVVALDSFLDVIPTFIKMDVEGSEMDALSGAINTIKAYRPKLAICVYHKFCDLWDIPMFIKKQCPDYKLTLRNHGYKSIQEVVLYAQT
jgi:FkbM family methyltransferase